MLDGGYVHLLKESGRSKGKDVFMIERQAPGRENITQ